MRRLIRERQIIIYEVIPDPIYSKASTAVFVIFTLRTSRWRTVGSLDSTSKMVVTSPSETWRLGTQVPTYAILCVFVPVTDSQIPSILRMWSCLPRKQQTMDLISSRKTSHGHNKDVSRLRYLLPGMRVNTWYINSTRGTSSKKILQRNMQS